MHTTDIKDIAEKAKKASIKICRLDTDEKNEILKNMAKSLDMNRAEILKANEIDVKAAREKNTKESLIDRLALSDGRISQMIGSIEEVIRLKDHVGEIITQKTLKNGLELKEIRTAFGVIGVIYESRPNVTVDVSTLCLKSSSAVILKGGSEAQNTNKAIVSALNTACPIKDAIQLIESTDRTATKDLIQLDRYIDLIIPRGGKSLIHFVRENSKIPVIETGTGNCHIYVDESADIDEAIKIIINAKTQRPGVCNAAEKVLVHENIAEAILPKLREELIKKNVEIRGDKKTQEIINCKPATDEDWPTEYLDLIIAIKIVKDTQEAIDHINIYGTRHSEAILSKNKKNIDTFFKEIDAAAVYSNASTRFTDGGEFGLGAEIGISTQKMHARGPMGLIALTTTKYLITGNGQIRT
ncbi:MAG: glutamate-5-semialdehyde dehydrogenase [archaeon]